MKASPVILDWKRLLLLVASAGAGIFLWDYRVLWPLKMLVVMMHESGHALAALIAGGSVASVTLASDQSGLCVSTAPASFFGQAFIYSSGYVGSAVAGATLMLLTYRFGLRRAVLWAACLWLGAMGLLYAGDLFTLLFCLGAAAAMGLGAHFLPPRAIEGWNLFLAAFASLYVLHDLKDDLWNSAVRSRSDAALLADVTSVPSVFWAALWTLVSVALLVASLYFSVSGRRRPEAHAKSAAHAEGHKRR